MLHQRDTLVINGIAGDVYRFRVTGVNGSGMTAVLLEGTPNLLIEGSTLEGEKEGDNRELVRVNYIAKEPLLHTWVCQFQNVVSTPDRRSFLRVEVSLDCNLVMPGRPLEKSRTRNIGSTGALVEVSNDLAQEIKRNAVESFTMQVLVENAWWEVRVGVRHFVAKDEQIALSVSFDHWVIGFPVVIQRLMNRLLAEMQVTAKGVSGNV